MATGGTAGHLAPALVVADQLRAAGHRVVFAASHGRRDEELVTARGFEVRLFSIGGIPRRPGWAQLRALLRTVGAVFVALRIVRREQPDVVLAGGGFVAAPVAIAARLLRVPVVATEADAHLGLANRVSARAARRLCTAYPLPQHRRRQEVTGRPVDPAFFTIQPEEARARFGLPAGSEARVVVVVGGSGGATRLNDAAWGAWGADPAPHVGDDPLWILHVSGRRDFPDIESRGIASERYRLLEYCDEMPALFAAADLVVSRPGGSLFELAAVGAPAVLVPSPNVTAEHQTKNARSFVAHGAGVIAADETFDADALRGIVVDLLGAGSSGRRRALGDAMSARARPDAARRIAEIVEQLGAAKVRRRGVRPTDDAPLAGRTFHMLGIGGAGVSALAQLCRAWGAEVSGCDRAMSRYAELVRADGIDVALGHDPVHVHEGMELVVSSALAKDHPEIVRAREFGCDVHLRGALLGELTRLRDSVVVAGAHGKSTTTGMLAHAAQLLDLDPAVAVGATLASLPGGNVRVGRGPFIVEGDESDRTLLELSARIAVVTNIERDHHHTYASDAEVEALFATWVTSLGPDSVLVAGPGAELDRLAPHARGRVIRFGRDDAEVNEIAARLAVPGRHNALNALAAVAVLVELGSTRDAAIDALTSFTGVGRRFEVHGENGGVLVVDDYAHHPTEVAAAIQAGREQATERGGRVLVAFQPHLYSRTQALWSEFADALAGADRAWVLPVYGAREAPIDGVDEQLIARALSERAPDVYAGHGVDDPATGDIATILGETMAGDVLITMGAGSVTALAPRLLAGPGSAGRDTSWLEHDVPLHKFTTIGTGGPARHFAKVENDAQLAEALAWAREANMPTAVVGLGSNSLISDAGFDGLAIRLAGELARIDVDTDALKVVLGGGASLAATVRLCREAGLAGFEFACAIPGTAGGATKMNAGAYGGEMGDVVTRVRIVDADGVRDVDPAQLNFRYRHSDVGWDQVVSEVELQLTRDEPDAIKARVKEMQGRRTDTQPRAARSFGSVFQNPAAGDGAGALIERAGLKGHRIGGARISPKHGNFIENDEQGTTADVLALIDLARSTVRNQFGVELHTEVHLLDRTGYRPLHDGVA